MDNLVNTATTLVVRNEKETEAGFDETSMHIGPLWLENTLNSNKRNVVPISVLLDDMVRKCLGKTLRVKKLKTISKIDFDADSGNWTVEIACPWIYEKTKDPTARHFIVEKVNIGTSSQATYVLHLEASRKNITTRTWKDERDKNELKESLKQMTEYIDAIHGPDLQPLSAQPTLFDPKSPSNQKFLIEVQRIKWCMGCSLNGWIRSEKREKNTFGI